MSKTAIRCDDAGPTPGQPRVGRCDFSQLGRTDKLERTPTGGIRVPARVSRTGVLVYLRADGSSFCEYRPPEEAFSPQSLASLEDAVVTVGHPTNALVTPETARTYGVGHVRGPGRQDGKFVASELAVLDGRAIDKVDRSELVDISSGYTCRLDMIPGTSPEGERYDAIQRDVRYNHVALLPAGAGRAGRDVSLRLDGVEVRLEAPQPPQPHARIDAMEEIIDGKKYTVGTPEWAAANERRRARQDAAEAETKSFREKLDETIKGRDALQAQLDAANSQIEQLKKDLGEATDETKMDARASARATLIETARKVLGAEAKLDGKSGDEIRREVIVKMDGASKLAGEDGKPKSTDYVTAYFDAMLPRIAGTTKRVDGRPEPRVAAPQPTPRGFSPYDLKHR